MIQVRAKLTVEDNWEADDLAVAKADAQQLAEDIRREHLVNVDVISVEEVRDGEA
jgi:hypothetical protein